MTVRLSRARCSSDFIRHQAGLTGTHVGCEHGVCGACTVSFDGEPVRSCLMLAVQADGHSLGTVEGLAGPDGELSPLQRAFTEHHALQCGFCTAGFLISSEALLRRRGSSLTRARDPRGARRQPVPLHGLRGDRRRGAVGGGSDRAADAQPPAVTLPCTRIDMNAQFTACITGGGGETPNFSRGRRFDVRALASGG